MPNSIEARTVLTDRRASGIVVAGAIDLPEVPHSSPVVQRIARRFGLTLSHAAVVAELALSVPETWRASR